LSGRSGQKIFRRAIEQVGIHKAATVHTLRHSFATHLLEADVDLYYIQRFLGHKTAQTTAIYLHVSRRDIARIVHPFDQWPADALPAF